MHMRHTCKESYRVHFHDSALCRGGASPCCFHHSHDGISLVVHGDDFTALSTDEGPDYLEEGVPRFFECELKGEIGHGAGDLAEMRVLNGVLRICPEGLLYEPDPRHVELAAKSFNFEAKNTKPSSTTGKTPTHKIPHDDEYVDSLGDILPPPLRVARSQCSKVTFNDDPETLSIPSFDCPMSQRQLLVVPLGPRDAVAIFHGHDMYTGLPGRDVQQLKQISCPHPVRARRFRLKRSVIEGPLWEMQTSDAIAAMAKHKRKGLRGVGVKAAKATERMLASQDLLGPTEATGFRARAAGANCLALDKPDVSFATKDPCRCFAAPNSTAVEAFKRLVKYLVTRPRLVWEFFNEQPCSELTTSVDADYAGCLVTRRSTSGGVAQRSKHLLKHWSATQPTMTLSSGEAEFEGGYAKVQAQLLD